MGYPLTMLQKIGWGFLLAAVAMVVAGGLEAYRLAHAPEPGDYNDKSARDNITPCQNIDDYDPNKYNDWYAGKEDYEPTHCSQSCSKTYEKNGRTYLEDECIDCDDIPQMSNVSVLWQAFQFSLIGASEILAAITSLEFFYSQAPSAMRSVSQSLNLFTNALGAFAVIPLLLLVNANPNDQWVPGNLDDGHLDYYFFLLAGLMLLSLLLFIYLAYGYEYKTTAELNLIDEQVAADAVKILEDELPADDHSHDGSKADVVDVRRLSRSRKSVDEVHTSSRHSKDSVSAAAALANASPMRAKSLSSSHHHDNEDDEADETTRFSLTNKGSRHSVEYLPPLEEQVESETHKAAIAQSPMH